MEPFPGDLAAANAKACKVVVRAPGVSTSESTELVETCVIKVKFEGSSSNYSVPVDLC